MICDDVAYLISEDPAVHGTFDKPTETKTMCFVRVNSVTRSEFYKARDNDIVPLYVLTLSEYADYNGEKIVEFREKRYRVIRAFVLNHTVELTIGEATADA